MYNNNITIICIRNALTVTTWYLVNFSLFTSELLALSHPLSSIPREQTQSIKGGRAPLLSHLCIYSVGYARSTETEIMGIPREGGVNNNSIIILIMGQVGRLSPLSYSYSLCVIIPRSSFPKYSYVSLYRVPPSWCQLPFPNL